MMKTFLVVFAALCAVAYAQHGEDHSVRIAEQPDKPYVIVNPDPGFYRPSNGNGGNGGNGNLNILPDSGFGGPSGGGGVEPSLNIHPDSGFANPSGGGGVQPSFGPTFVPTPLPYPYKQYYNPNARGGK